MEGVQTKDPSIFFVPIGVLYVGALLENLFLCSSIAPRSTDAGPAWREDLTFCSVSHMTREATFLLSDHCFFEQEIFFH